MSPPEATEPYDLVVIGGGIIGSGLARDAALRGLRVVVVEKEDFGWGTTARSTRLIHGGLRYLEHLDLALVREALRERGTLLRIAPHLVAPIPMLFPIWKRKGRGKLVIRIGMVLYDLLARRNVGTGHAWWGRKEVLAHEPTLDRPDLKGAFLFWDCQAPFPERLVIENLLDVKARGGAAWNHTEAIGLDRTDRTATAVLTRDRLTGETQRIPCRFVVNTAGPWVTEVDSRIGTSRPAMTRRTKGIHLVTPSITQRAMVLQCGDGERIIFIIPWRGFSLIGTTDTDYAGPNDDVNATEEDVRYLLDEVNATLRVHLTPDDVQATYAGIRSLIHETKGTTGAVSRRHLIVEHKDRDGPDNLITVVGGKITSFRAIAQGVCDRVVGRLGVRARCTTAKTPMPGGVTHDRVMLLRALGSRLPHLTDVDVERLSSLYGARIGRLLDMAATLGNDVGFLHPASRLTREEVLLAIVDEGARTLDDVLLRRTMVGLEAGQGLEVAAPAAAFLAKRLRWSDERRDDEVQRYRDWALTARRPLVALKGYQPSPPDTRIAKKRI